MSLNLAMNYKNNERAQGVTLLQVSRGLVYLGLFFKQFYLFSSGSFQIGDFILMLGAGCCLAYMGGSLKIDKTDNPLVLFIILETVVNCIWFFLTGDNGFLIAIARYVYILIFIICVKNHIYERRFIEGLVATLRVALFVQLAILLMHAGRWLAASRYMGTFNDPNQYAFFVFSAFLTIKLCGKKGYVKNSLIDTVVALILVAESASTGMALGFALYFFFELVFSKRSASTKAIVLILIALLAVVMLPKYASHEELLPKTGIEVVDRVFARINQKINKFDSSDSLIGEVVADRGLKKITYYPEYIFVGSGEALMERFEGAGRNELHSTPLALLFYYGIIPFAVFCSWIVQNYRKGGSEQPPAVLLSLVCESMFLAHQRQPLFYLIVTLYSLPNYIREAADSSD